MISSYNQVTKPTTVGLALVTAFGEIAELASEMEELCAEIGGMFPDTYERIPKYIQAQDAYSALGLAEGRGRDAGLVNDHGHRAWAAATIMVTVGKQTRQNRTTSQRVRLGNACQRLESACQMLRKVGAEEHTELEAIITSIKNITFPAAHG